MRASDARTGRCHGSREALVQNLSTDHEGVLGESKKDVGIGNTYPHRETRGKERR